MLRFGIFDHLDADGPPLGDMLEKRLKLVELMDREGFYGFHMAEHHSTPLGWVPSPSVFVSAAIQRTKRLRIGPLVYVLPMYHPLRVYEEVCMLDHMSNGTLHVRGRPRRRAGRASALRHRSGAGARDVSRGLCGDHEGLRVRRAEFRGQVLQLQGLPRSVRSRCSGRIRRSGMARRMPMRSAGPHRMRSTWCRSDRPRAPGRSPIATARTGPSSAARLPTSR